MSDPNRLSERQRRYLAAMAVPVWVRRSAALEKQDPAACPIDRCPAPPASGPRGEDWEPLAARVAACSLCPLHACRTQTVFGVGSRRADWMLVGEAPGADEDRQGEPFVGRAGKLLNAMLRAVDLRREDVYIANILKCRPPGNRDPRPEEAAACRPYLDRQIELIAPKLILAIGRVAAQNLLATTEPIGRLRGRVRHYGDTGIAVIVTYHPAYLLRSPLQKQRAWEDLKLARAVSGAAP